MLLLFDFLASNSHREKLSASFERLGKRISSVLARLRSDFASIRAGTVLLYVIAFYLVFSRLGPVITRVGETAVERLDLSSAGKWPEEDLQLLRQVYKVFRHFTRVPAPLRKRSDDRLLVVLVTMGNRSSSKKVLSDEGAGSANVEGKDVSDNRGGSDESEARTEETKPPVKRRFSEIEESISTGDLALLFREGSQHPHYAVFVNHADCDPNFPLLLIKGKTRPLSMDKFNPRVRNIHPISATTRIFYGDYHSVAIRHITLEEPIGCAKVMGLVEKVEKIPFSKEELDALQEAQTPEERSVLACTFTMAHLYKELGLFSGEPSTIRPDNFQGHFPLSNPHYIELPPVKLGPVATGDAPFFAQLVEGIMPSKDVVTRPYTVIEKSLKTGDLVLFSGATSSGALIKLFDHSVFSHVGIVLKAKYTSQLLIWEASTNKAGLVDIESGEVTRGVELLPLRHKIFSGWYNRVAIRRLVDVTEEQRVEMYAKLLQIRRELQGRPYEKDQVQLILSAIDAQEWFLSFLRNTHEDLSSLFCSELVAAVYQRMGLLGYDKLSNEYTPDDFASHRGLTLKFGRLEREQYVELKFDFTDGAGFTTQESVY